MLTIRKEQMDVLASVPRMEFEQSLLRHFLRFYPDDCARMGTGHLRELVELGVNRAANHGYTSRGEAGLYCNLMFMLGCDFDSDPQIPWAAREVHCSPAVEDSLEKIKRLFDTALDYLQKAFEEDEGYLKQALHRLRNVDLYSIAPSRGPELERDLLKLLEFLCPEKFRTQGEEANRALIRQGLKDAARYGISSGRSLALYIMLMFMMGVGFARDPMYPWAGPILTDPASNETDKADRLFSATVGYIDQVLRR